MSKSEARYAPSVRRVVTGHDSEGMAVVASDEVMTGPGDLGTLLWTTDTSPADNADEADGAKREVGLAMDEGTVFRLARLEPGHRSPMHRTLSVDYGLVLEGELTLELDGGDDVNLKAGDVVVQRGTNHVWFNAGEKACLIAFILISAKTLSFNGKPLDPTPPIATGASSEAK